MTFLGVKLVALRSLELPGDMPRRKEGANAAGLGEQLEQWGRYLHHPIVRKSDLRVITGRDRIAGAMRLGRRELECELVDCTDEEAEELELVENFVRRHDPEEQAAERRRHLDILEARQPKEEAPKPGRPKSARAKAREELAEREGVTPDAIRMQERRREEPEAESAQEPEALPPCIRDFGVTVPPTVNARAQRVQAVVDEMDTHLRALSALVGGLEASGAVARDVQKAKDAHQRYAYDIRGLRPQALCPRCAGVVGVENCPMCFAAGFVSAEKMRGDIPANLLEEGAKKQVADKGGYRLLSGESVAAPRTGLGGRRLRVEGPSGEALEVPPADDDGAPF